MSFIQPKLYMDYIHFNYVQIDDLYLFIHDII